MMRWWFLLLALYCVSCVPVGKRSSSHAFVRRTAPGFQLIDQSGISRSLDEFRGKVVLLNFWAPWCVTCAEEMAAFKEIRAYFSEAPFEIVAITVLDSGQRIPETHLPFSVLMDVERKVADTYGVKMLPVTFILDKEGRFASFPDPRNGEPAEVFQGPRGWRSKMTVDALQRLMEE